MPHDDISEYEKERLEQIARNREVLESLNINVLKSEMKPTPAKRTSASRKRKFEHTPVPESQRRRSARISGIAASTEKSDIIESGLDNFAPRHHNRPPHKSGDLAFDACITHGYKDDHEGFISLLQKMSFGETWTLKPTNAKEEKKELDVKPEVKEVKQEKADSEDEESEQEEEEEEEKPVKKSSAVTPRRSARLGKRGSNSSPPKKRQKLATKEEVASDDEVSSAKNKKQKKSDVKEEPEEEVEEKKDASEDEDDQNVDRTAIKFKPSIRKTLDYSKFEIKTHDKVVPERSYSIAMHPSSDRVLACIGDKWGRIGFLGYSNASKSDDDNVVMVYEPHSKPVPGLKFSPSNVGKLYSASYGGNVRCMDLVKEKFLDVYELEDQINCLDVDPKNDVLYFGSSAGDLVTLDVRSGKATVHEAHAKKVSGVSIHPTEGYLATGSNDGTVCIWDLRKMKKPIHTFAHDKAVTSLSYSRNAGSYLASVSYDDRIRVWKDHELVKSISHNNNTGRWVTPFRVTFDPKKEDLFCVGNMKRAMEIFSAEDGKCKSYLDSEDLTAIPSLNAFHPSLDAMASSTASGRLYIWM